MIIEKQFLFKSNFFKQVSNIKKLIVEDKKAIYIFTFF